MALTNDVTALDGQNSSMFSVISVLQIFLLLLIPYLIVYRWTQRNKPGPKEWPLLGSAIEMTTNFERFQDWLLIYFAHAKTFTARLPTHYISYTVDPVVVEHILKNHFTNYPKGKNFHEIMEVVLGDGIFNTDGESWKRQRKTASFEFSSKVLREFSAVVFRDYALKLARIVSHAAYSKEAIEMQEMYMRLTLDSICKVGFGTELQILSPSLPDNPFANAFDHANATIMLRFVDPFWKAKKFLGIGREASIEKSSTTLDNFTYKIIRARRAEIKVARASGKANMKPDLLSRFMELSEDPENNMTDKTLRDIVLNFIIAGRDTTAATLSWFTYMMAIHPEIADKIYEELVDLEKRSMSKESANSTLTNLLDLDEESFNKRLQEFETHIDHEGLLKLPYLHAALTETLRVYPAIPLDIKGIAEDDVAPDGTVLKKGGLIGYSPYCMGRMEFIWGPDAREYKPERWLKNGVFYPESPFKFTAFQGGPRICLGKDSAYLQMKVTASLLFRFFKFNLVPGHKVVYRTMTALGMAHGLKVTITKRVH
ncbi:hypothetical protein O6H91_20G029200 [Diphasiastrum complanatum]|uniref:Uncharacterized protein n=1 Tax=Diphasiastrum complanatum TaxID=34168 RepID=A0ACC2ANT2_DIPCM|nr:hypothetical protein O6H91_20G029200 [Diphasiastrum complanatum]